MKEPVRVRVGMTSAREIEMEVDDADAIATGFEAAVSSDTPVFWVTDTKGIRHGLVVAKIAFVEIEEEEARRGVGFKAEE